MTDYIEHLGVGDMDGFGARVSYSEDAVSPLEGEEAIEWYIKHSRYNFGLERFSIEEVTEIIEELDVCLRRGEAGGIVREVRMYEHGGVALSFGDWPSGMQWDVSFMGYAIMRPEKAARFEDPEKYMDQQLGTLDRYLNGTSELDVQLGRNCPECRRTSWKTSVTIGMSASGDDEEDLADVRGMISECSDEVGDFADGGDFSSGDRYNKLIERRGDLVVSVERRFDDLARDDGFVEDVVVRTGRVCGVCYEPLWMERHYTSGEWLEDVLKSQFVSDGVAKEAASCDG